MLNTVRSSIRPWIYILTWRETSKKPLRPCCPTIYMDSVPHVPTEVNQWANSIVRTDSCNLKYYIWRVWDPVRSWNHIGWWNEIYVSCIGGMSLVEGCCRPGWVSPCSQLGLLCKVYGGKAKWPRGRPVVRLNLQLFSCSVFPFLHWSWITVSTQLITQSGIVSTQRPAEFAL